MQSLYNSYSGVDMDIIIIIIANWGHSFIGGGAVVLVIGETRATTTEILLTFDQVTRLTEVITLYSDLMQYSL